MATWGVHMRLAEEILKKSNDLDEVSFLIGNIGPDCCEPNEDYTAFTPSKKVSHWLDDDKNIIAEEFYDAYLNQELDDKKQKSFYIGYYVHLLTDIEWGKMVDKKKTYDENYMKLEHDNKFIWTIKEDWYDLDHLYFRDNPDNIFNNLFKNIKDFPNYLEYYTKDNIPKRIKYITDFYLQSSDNLDREYPYLKKEEMDTFIDESLEVIIDDIRAKKLI